MNKYEFGRCMHLYGGELVDPFEIRPEHIDIRDIAHALARICRYGGHVRSYYSVAEHSVRVSEIAEERSFVPHGDDPLHNKTMAKYGLLHDGTEAYLGDVIRGIKKRPEMQWYKNAEKQLEAKILLKFGLGPALPSLVHEIDLELVGTEMRQLLFLAVDLNNTPLHPSIPGLVVGLWSPEEAETRFLARYQELFQ